MVSNSPESILALDFGSARIGVAVASLVARLPRPLYTINNDANFLDNLNRVIADENVVQLVVGYPRGLDGQSTQQTELAQAFADDLRTKISLPIDLQDEALTSAAAKEELIHAGKDFVRSDIDSLAATYILSDWFGQHDKIVR